MRVLLDTNVLVRATGASAGPAQALLLRLAAPPHALVLSAFLLDELRRVLAYPRMLSQTVLHDPDDDPMVACAVYGRADVLCTLDRHLHVHDVRAYCAPFKIRVLTDAELLAELRAEDPHLSE